MREKKKKKEQPGCTLCKLKGVNHRMSQLVPVEGDATSRTDTRLGGEGLVECASELFTFTYFGNKMNE